jgi:nitrous oxidase accessory protein NosD
MKHSLLKTTGPILATLLFTSALAGAATVIDHVPYAITAPGEYELKSDLTASDTDGIDVQAENVVVDFNGFSLTQTQEQAFVAGIIIEDNVSNVILRNGTVSGFAVGVSVSGTRCKVQDLRVLGNFAVGVKVNSGDNNAVLNCFVIGPGRTGDNQSLGIYLAGPSGTLVKGNHVSAWRQAIVSDGGSGNAFIQNYVANSKYGLQLSRSPNDYYQSNVVTNCTTAFLGGDAIGTENGGD